MSLTPKFPHFLHGGDYNPDQWLDRPDILEKDIELMQEAHVNCVSVGIFAWATLEPEEGVYNFEWLDQVIDRLWKGGIHVFLATPSGARPSWMAQKYPEVLRVNNQHQRMHFGERHNHCYTSPYYRQKVQEMDTKLAERYANHPAVLLWHLSNEYGGECHCPLCQEAFRGWLKEKYGTLENLNRCWWTNFWSQRYTDWSQVESPSPLGEVSSTSLWVDWRRFCTAQTKSFMMMERDAVKAVNPELKCTANLMERFWDYDYFSLAEGMDVVSWDAYPEWHREKNDTKLAAEFAMSHDLFRSLKNQPFLLMESTPSQVNWKPHNKLKRPGMHLLSSMQAVAHGSQSVMYFQWRKGRGSAEMFHGAVVDHYGESDTRVFRDVTDVGVALENLEPIYNEQRKADVLLMFDWENRWALDYAQTGHRQNMHYFDTVNAHYRALWEKGISVDLADMREVTDLSGYKLVICPMLFMFRNDFDKKLREYVANGGTLVITYLTGVVDEFDLAYLEGVPHGLRDVVGLRSDALDAIWPHETNEMVIGDKRYTIRELCEIPAHITTAETVGEYASDFYAGLPCLTKNAYGEGEAWWIGGQLEQDGLAAVYGPIIEKLGIQPALPDALPAGVIATQRGKSVFLQNFSGEEQTVVLAGKYTDLITGKAVTGSLTFPVNGVMVLVEA